MNKSPPKKRRGRAQAKGSNSPRSVAPKMPLQPTGTTKTKHKKQKTSQLANRNLHILLKELWVALYYPTWFWCKSTLAGFAHYHNELQLAFVFFEFSRRHT